MGAGRGISLRTAARYSRYRVVAGEEASVFPLARVLGQPICAPRCVIVVGLCAGEIVSTSHPLFSNSRPVGRPNLIPASGTLGTQSVALLPGRIFSQRDHRSLFASYRDAEGAVVGKARRKTTRNSPRCHQYLQGVKRILWRIPQYFLFRG